MDEPRWWERLLALLAALLGSPREPRPRRLALRHERKEEALLDASRVEPVAVGPALPCDLLILTGAAAIPLFPAGPTDPLCFFQRRGVPEEHDVEYVVRAEGGDVQPWAVLNMRADLAVTLPSPQRAESFWRDLYRAQNLASLPKASALLRGLDTGAFDLTDAAPTAGRNVLACPRPDTVWKKVRGRPFTHADALSFVRAGLRGVHLIAWIEEAFSRRLPAGEVVHRYYVDRGHVYLLRHHWAGGKTLFLARPSDEALPLLASHVYRRAA
jgi:hypothetical protein